MNYALHITVAAEQDLAAAVDHIEFVLMNPTAADDLLNEAEVKINALASFPNKFALVDDSMLASWGIRFTQVKNYLAFYVVSEEYHQIAVIRFLYEKSNWISVLKRGFSLV